MTTYSKDIQLFKAGIPQLPKFWDGKTCVLELKEADYNWRQMEWWAFYFEYKFRTLFAEKFMFPGDKFDSVTFDLKGKINWDLKAKAIKSDDHKVILNDKSAMEQSIANKGFHGEIIALCDVEYNDVDWDFRKWQAEVKGEYDFDYEKSKSFSLYKYCITNVELVSLLFIIIKKSDLQYLSVLKNQKTEKYVLNFEEFYLFENILINI